MPLEQARHAPVAGLNANYDWKDIEQMDETTHLMQFWMKAL